MGTASSTPQAASSAGDPSLPTLPKDAPGTMELNDRDVRDEDDLEGQTIWEMLTNLFSLAPNPLLGSGLPKVIVDTFDLRRHALRARANELSRLRIRRLKVTDLPLEILRLIFDNFQGQAVKNGDRVVDWAIYRQPESLDGPQTVRNARLVSRLFCELATPLMFPVLRVQISQSSLDLAEKISKCPRMAAGVRGIQVSLGYRPEELAYDILQFGETRLADLEVLQKMCDAARTQRVTLGHMVVDQQRLADLDKALLNMSDLWDDWVGYMDSVGLSESDSENTPPAKPLTQYQDMLLTAHDEFALLHDEQYNLLHISTFLNTLVSAIRRMGNVRSLRFTDRMDPQRLNHDTPDNYLLPLIDMTRLHQFLVAPLPWDVLENGPFGPSEMTPAQLFWQLPIALHEAGVPLRELKIDVIPVCPLASVLRPSYPTSATGNGPKKPAPWHKLSAACASLQSFELLGRNRVGFGYGQMGPEDCTDITHFVSAILASCTPHGLRTLILDFIPFDPSTIGDITPYDRFPASALVGALPAAMPQLRKLLVRGVELDQSHLEAVCGWPGDGRLESLSLAGIELPSGRWADAVDILRQKLVTDKVGKARWCYLESLRGGEFDNMETWDVGSDWEEDGDAMDGEMPWRAWWPSWRPLTQLDEEWYGMLAWPHLGCVAVAYMMGELDENPLWDEMLVEEDEY